MASILPSDGAETTISLTVNGAPVLINGQVDGFDEKQETTEMTHMPLGTMDVEVAQDLRGWSGTMSTKQGNKVLSQAMDLIDAATRTGIKPVVAFTRTTRFRDGTKESYLYLDAVLSWSGARKRGEFDTNSVSWRTGKARVAL